MNVALVIVGAASLAILASAGLAMVPADPAGAAWDDTGPSGHHQLVESLSRDHTVRVLESSLTLLPEDSGPGDTLFLFASGRSMSPQEAARVARFAQQGGTLVIATDTPGMGALGSSLEVSLHGLPAVRAEGEGCVDVEVPVRESTPSACLPSPTALPDTALDTAGVSFSFVARAKQPVYFDLDESESMTIEDRAPVHASLAVGWTHGEGRIVAIADADLWRNRVLAENPQNSALALALVDGTGTVYIDGTGSESTQGGIVRSAWLDTLAVEPWTAWTPVVVFVATLIFLVVAPRLKPWHHHRSDPEGMDPEVRERAQAMLEREFQGGPVKPTGSQGTASANNGSGRS